MEQNYIKAIHAAIDAGIEIMKVYDSEDFQVERKGDDSPLTLADRNGHLKIMEYLEKTDIPVLSEEGNEIPYDERKDWEQLWIVDPLDGTKEFIKRNGDFTVNIALTKNHKSVFGVIYVPVHKVLYVGIDKLGAFKLNNISDIGDVASDFESIIQEAIALPIRDANRPFTVMASRSHMSPETQEYIDNLKEIHPNLEFSSRGSSLKLCAVAEGSADVYPRFGPTMEWDTAAGQAIVEASGGSVKLISGEPLNYNRKDLLNAYFIVSR